MFFLMSEAKVTFDGSQWLFTFEENHVSEMSIQFVDFL